MQGRRQILPPDFRHCGDRRIRERSSHEPSLLPLDLLSNFIVEGEKGYLLVAHRFDRFDGTVVGQQLEEVLE